MNLATAGLKYFSPEIRLPKASKAMKAWAARAPSKPCPFIPESAVIFQVSTALRRGRVNVAGWMFTSFVCLPLIYLSARILFQDVSLPGDSRFAGMGAACFIGIGYDKCQETASMVDVYDELCIELLELLTETHPANDWRLFMASSAILRRKLETLCREVGWQDLNFVPHSLRYDGAVYEKAVQNLHVAEIQ